MKDKLLSGAIILFWVMVFMWLFGGGSSDEYDAKHTITVDCTNPAQAHSPVCTGDSAAQIQEEDGVENNYYQNVVR